MLSGSRGLVDGLPTLSNKLRCPKLPLPCTSHYYHRRLILVLSWLASSLWYPAPAVIHEKHCVSSTTLVVRVCRLACLLDVTLKTTRKTWLTASDFVWSWYICCPTKICHMVRSFNASRHYCKLVSKALEYSGVSPGKQSSAFIAPLITSQLFLTGRKNWYLLLRKRKDGSRSWVQIACDRCWRFWRY